MGMGKPSLNRPPRAKRPPEVVRHVGSTLDALRKVQESEKVAGPTRPGTSATRRPEG